MDGPQLIDLLKRDPSQGMMRTISEYGGLVRGIVDGIVPAGKRQDIEDCFSSELSSLWEHRDNLSQKGSVKNYLAASARNTVINCLWKNKPCYEALPLEENQRGLRYFWRTRCAAR